MILWLAAVSGMTFALTSLGLCVQIRKIWRRGAKPPRIGRLLLFGHIGRFVGWSLLGACMLRVDPIIGWLFMLTRIPGAILTGVTVVQKYNPRPRPKTLALALGVPSLVLVASCTALALITSEPWVKQLLMGFVGVCFGTLLLFALPREILRVSREGAFGSLRWFQITLLLNYLVTFLLGFLTNDSTLGLFINVVYGIAAAEQGYLVFLIERSRRSYRANLSSQEPKNYPCSTEVTYSQ